MIDILTRAAALFDVEVERIVGRGRGMACRGLHVTAARQAVCWALRDAGYRVVEIGAFLDGRDHSTIVYAAEQAAQRARQSVEYALLLTALRKA